MMSTEGEGEPFSHNARYRHSTTQPSEHTQQACYHTITYTSVFNGNCLSLPGLDSKSPPPRRRNNTKRPDAFPDAHPTVSKHWMQMNKQVSVHQ